MTSDLFQQVGMPKRKTHRGHKKPKRDVGKPHDHHKAMKDALDKGDHGAVRKHAFALIRSLPADVGAPDAPPAANSAARASIPQAAPPPKPVGNASRLVMALRGKK